MITVYKYPLIEKKVQVIAMPEGAKILSVQPMLAEICLWAMVDTDKPNVNRTFLIWDTGTPIDVANGKYIGTVINPFGMVRHVFEG